MRGMVNRAETGREAMQLTAERQEPSAFGQYRAASKPVTAPRILAGVAVIVVTAIVATLAVFGASEAVLAAWPEAASPSVVELVMLLLSLGGLWVGAWLAMRFIHREPLAVLLGSTRRIDWRDFARGALATIAVLAASELALLAWGFEVQRSQLPLAGWLAAGLPLALLALLQTSAEEIVFRGYLMQRLANRFRSPLVYALLPGIAFTLLHVTPGMSAPLLAFNLASIGATTLLLALAVMLTGNLGAAMGIHLANNFFIFWILQHQPELGVFALWAGTPVEGLVAAPGALAFVLFVVLAGTAATAALLFHRRSPLALSSVRPGAKLQAKGVEA